MSTSIYTDVPGREVTPLLLGIAEAAQHLNMGLTFLRAEVKAKRIPYVRMGNRIMFRPDDLRLYIAARVVGTVQ